MRRIFWTAVVMLTACLAGCAVTTGSTRESVGDAVHSARITSMIALRYQADRLLAPLGLRVETYRREVFISGLVQDEAQRARAVTIAQDTPGVLAVYFVDTDLPGRPVSRAHYRATPEEVWGAALAAIRAAGYQIENRRVGRSLVTQWKRVQPGWRTLWLSTQERVRLALYPHGEIVTVIAVVDRLDEGTLLSKTRNEESILQNIREALDQRVSSHL